MSAATARSAWPYTSVSVALCHTAAMAPPTSAAATPAADRPVHRVTNHAKQLDAAAVDAAEARFAAYANGRKESNDVQARTPKMKSGVPGGCGIPRLYAVARNSPLSHSVTVGASVRT